MLKRGKVSVWVGNMTSEDELLSYLDDGGFASDFDFEVNPRLGRELKSVPHPATLERLVEGFSSWRVFGKACVKKGQDIGLHSANCMVVFYAFEYVPSLRINQKAPLAFVGSFDF